MNKIGNQTSDVQTFIAKELHSLLFLEEFVFSRSQFSPPASSEVELADAVVMLGEVLLIFQIKERALSHAGDADAERRWFQKQVLGKATKQVRDTLRYLKTYSDIRIPNERGRVFNLAASAFADILKIVVYRPSPNLPADCRQLRHHISGTAGLIHIVEAHDYVELSRTLRVPEEVVRYFKYREFVLTGFGGSCVHLPEPAIAGHFVGADPELPPTVQSVQHLHRLVNDEEEWDLAPFLRRLYEGLSVTGISDDYYDILIEFAKLPRSTWREVKKRILLCIEKVKQDEFTRPYRIVWPATDCGFVFIPVPPEVVSHEAWATTFRLRGLQQMTQAHKYDQRLSKCIGIQVAKDGSYFDILRCLIDHPWTEDPEFQKSLSDNFPFRQMKGALLHGYHLSGE